MKVLVTGAGGFIGSHVVERCLRDGAGVVATDHPKVSMEDLAEAGAHCEPADVTQPGALAPLLDGCDTVIHSAGLFHFGASWSVLKAINVDGFTHAAQAAARAGVRRFVALSSVAVYGEPGITPCPESAAKAPRNAYERSKWAGEAAAFEWDGVNGMRVTALRPTLVYGPRSRYGHALYLGLFSLLRARGVRSTVGLASGPLTHHVHVADVAEAAWLLATHPGAAGQSFNIADDTPVRTSEFLEILAGSTGVEIGTKYDYSPRTLRAAAWGIKHLPGFLVKKTQARTQAAWKSVVRRHQLETPLDVRFDIDWGDYLACDLVYDTRKIKQLGMRLTQPRLADGIADVADWYRSHRWIPAA